jgi:hypothetical protein
MRLLIDKYILVLLTFIENARKKYGVLTPSLIQF